MSFRNISLIFITTLLTSILLLQWWSISNFTNDISRQVGESAFEVSRSTAETLIFEKPKIEFRSIMFSSSVLQVPDEAINKAISSIKQDVTIQLHNELKDDFIILNADGADYQIPIPRTGIDEALEHFSNKVLYSTLILLLLGIVLAALFTHKIASPLKSLQLASKQIGEGKLGAQVSKDNQWHTSEIETTLDSFNLMSTKIQNLQQQNQQLQNKAHLAELAEIARGLAHTIRNPLNTLNLAIDQINSGVDQQQQQQLSATAKHQVARIDKWVRSLMDVMSDDNELVKSVNLTEIINAVVQDLQLTSDNAVSIIFIPPAEKITLLAVNSELKSLLQSLVANAVEASPDNSEVTIKLSKFESNYQISIVDQGKGFSDKVLKNLFSPHNTDKTYGAGMGLYLAHRIIKHKYQGDIKIKNNTNGGCRVSVIINDRG